MKPRMPDQEIYCLVCSAHRRHCIVYVHLFVLLFLYLCCVSSVKEAEVPVVYTNVFYSCRFVESFSPLSVMFLSAHV
jgi:hypothetical protein